MIKSRRVLVVLAAILSAVILSLITTSSDLADAERPHPFLRFEDGQGISFEILQFRSASTADCQGQLATFSNTVRATCPGCRLLQSACLGGLNETQARLLSTLPIDAPTMPIGNGVIVFGPTGERKALTACMQAAASIANPGSGIECFAPGTTRKLIGGEITDSSRPNWIARTAATFLALAAVLISVEIVFTGRFGHWLLGLSRGRKRVLVMAIDLVIVELSLWLAYFLRFDVLTAPEQRALILFMAAPAIALPIFASFGLYRVAIRFLGFQAMGDIAKAVLAYSATLTAVVFMLSIVDVPRSVLIIQTVLLLLLVGTSRALARAWLRQAVIRSGNNLRRKNVVIYGAGSAGIQLANALTSNAQIHPVAFVDDDTRLHRTRIGSLEVRSSDEFRDIVRNHGVTEVLLAIPSASRRRRNEIIQVLESIPIQVRTMPALSDLVEGKHTIEDLQEVDIEDLLGRDAVAPDTRLLSARITGKAVMVTGAGGSIGSELCRQIAKLRPTRLVLLEQSEYALYQIEKELRSWMRHSEPHRIEIFPLLGSVTDFSRMERVIRAMKVNSIYHAAAYKHVPMVEGNPCEGAFNNIFGTYRTALAAMRNGVETFVLISTDKAVRPTNTMGATKRFAELVIQAFAASQSNSECATRFSAVRFGNVLGSSGSVIPLFREQIRRGGPVTVTDPRIVRYFMTVTEAAQLVLQASSMGDAGDVHVLDMGSPVRILDLAHRMIRLSGLKVRDEDHPDGDVSIEFSGLRPGEKLYEELLIGDNASPTAHPRIMRAAEESLSLEAIEQAVNDLKEPLLSGDSSEVRNILMRTVGEFEPQCGNEDYLQSQPERETAA